MYARTTLLEVDTLRVSMDAALATFVHEVLPQLRDQLGFCGVFALTAPAGAAMLVTFWETAEQADAHESGWYPDVLAEHMTMFRSPPGREHYEVQVAVPPPAIQLPE